MMTKIYTIIDLLSMIHGPDSPPVNLEGKTFDIHGSDNFWEQLAHGRGLTDGTARGFDFTVGGIFSLMSGAIMIRANLENAVFSNCNLGYAKLMDAILSSAKLNDCILDQANCTGASFVNTDLGGAHCESVKFDYCDFTNANLSGGYFWAATFHNCDLRGANMQDAKFISRPYRAIYNRHTVLPYEYPGRLLDMTDCIFTD